MTPRTFSVMMLLRRRRLSLVSVHVAAHVGLALASGRVVPAVAVLDGEQRGVVKASQLGEARRVLHVVVGDHEQRVLQRGAVVPVAPRELLEGHPCRDRGQHGDVHLHGEARRQLHLHEVAKLPEVLELWGDDLKGKNDSRLIKVHKFLAE